MSERVCHKCGFAYPSDQSHCPHCGVRFVNPVLRACLIGCAVVAGIAILLLGACFLILTQALNTTNQQRVNPAPVVHENPPLIRDNPGAKLDPKSLPTHPKAQ